MAFAIASQLRVAHGHPRSHSHYDWNRDYAPPIFLGFADGVLQPPHVVLVLYKHIQGSSSSGASPDDRLQNAFHFPLMLVDRKLRPRRTVLANNKQMQGHPLSRA